MIVQLEDGRWSARCEDDDCGRIAEIPEGSLVFAKRYLRAGGWSTGPGLTTKDTYCPLHDAEYTEEPRVVVHHGTMETGPACGGEGSENDRAVVSLLPYVVNCPDCLCLRHEAHGREQQGGRGESGGRRAPRAGAETVEAMAAFVNGAELREEDGDAYEFVDHPAHYGGADDPYEVIKVIEAWGLNFNLGTLVRYVARAGKKPGEDALRDLKKARWYLDREIQRRERA